ncbi:MAG: hypothetical protein WBJ45_10785 [Limnohabitans sp.]|uniref:hypothetical protein n=1 Tax=Limnohabitans sp. TaxID=1907725 RepID=UPI0030E14D49
MKTHACAVILLGHLEPARLLNIEREAIWERVWFIHGHHDTDHGFKALDTLARRMGVRMTAHGHQHDNIDSSAQWDAQGFQSFGVGLRGVMAVDGLD